MRYRRPDPILTFGNMSPYVIDGVTYNVLEDYSDYREQGTRFLVWGQV